jgi:anti-sigma factor RsiW
VRVLSLKCREVIEFLDRYIADELPAGQRREFDWHLRLCRSCRAYLRTYRETILLGKKTHAGTGKDAAGEIPEELVAAILASSHSIRR